MPKTKTPALTSLIGTPFEALESQLPTAPIAQIASIIRREWFPMSVYAVLYCRAMGTLDSLESNYYAETGRDIVLGFLTNAGQWRGPLARAIKAELARRLGEK